MTFDPTDPEARLALAAAYESGRAASDEEPNPFNPARYYAGGVPVAVTMNPTGTVTLDFDLSEIGDLVTDDEEAPERYDEDAIVADSNRVESIAQNMGNTFTVTLA